MKTSQKGIDLIKQFEGCILTAYPDPASELGQELTRRKIKLSNYQKIDYKKFKGDPWTIGFGETGSNVKPGLTITKEVAETMLKTRLEEFEKQLDILVKVPLNSNQHAALISFLYNVGYSNLKRSTLLKRINLGLFKEAAESFLPWDIAGGKVLPGLTKRRQAERLLFLTLG